MNNQEGMEIAHDILRELFAFGHERTFRELRIVTERINPLIAQRDEARDDVLRLRNALTAMRERGYDLPASLVNEADEWGKTPESYLDRYMRCVQSPYTCTQADLQALATICETGNWQLKVDESHMRIWFDGTYVTVTHYTPAVGSWMNDRTYTARKDTSS